MVILPWYFLGTYHSNIMVFFEVPECVIIQYWGTCSPFKASQSSAGMLGNGGKALYCLNGKRLKLLVKIAIKSENYSNIIKLFSLAELALKSIFCDIWSICRYCKHDMAFIQQLNNYIFNFISILNTILHVIFPIFAPLKKWCSDSLSLINSLAVSCFKDLALQRLHLLGDMPLKMVYLRRTTITFQSEKAITVVTPYNEHQSIL